MLASMKARGQGVMTALREEWRWGWEGQPQEGVSKLRMKPEEALAKQERVGTCV